MNCFWHQSDPAVGTCKSCGRGLCAGCSAEVDGGLACRDRCEKDVAAITDLIRTNIVAARDSQRSLRGSRRVMMAIGVFIVLFGVLFIWVSTLGESLIWALLVLGVLIASFGVFQFSRALRSECPGRLLRERASPEPFPCR